MTTVYYAGSDVLAPEPVKCDQIGYPNDDIKGRKMYDNSHFLTIEDAWQSLRSNALAGEQLALNDLTATEAAVAVRLDEARSRFIAAARRSIAIRTALGEGWR